ncbi:site-2 protease family protein [Candidatus Synechococcus calcipolaris G9]|uniref:Zinc metalloprotease n=1 Tax=Candidatus Synechococcus calcipolaris G9 TaxID=1497997 RepID=A0ABT6F378_9SYNE|nr:site-2 protease family protein [Candidatus Synechococcus calcipolaris]MDG2992233.1 site-2 protease family protein [Candidatus Synechococcus calcipolaris G9]
MGQTWQVGKLFGIPLYIDRSWFIVIALFTFLNGSDWQQTYPNWGLLAWIAGLAVSLLLFASVLLHELGHSLVARSQGITVRSITLFLFGGVASIERESSTPGQAFQVAIAGPLVSLGLFIALSGLSYTFPQETPWREMVTYLAGINLILALFNLLPGLPLDGGQILKAGVWKLTGDRFQGIHWAARSGQILGWLAISFGAVSFFLLGTINGLWIAFLGWFALRNATLYNRMTTMQEMLLQVKASDVMSRDYRVVDAHISLREFADRYLLLADQQPTAYFAAADGRYRGRIDPKAMNHVERSTWEHTPLSHLAVPLDATPSVSEATNLATVIHELEVQNQPYLTVLSPAGAVVGVIDRGDIVQSLGDRFGWAVNKTDIETIKKQASYPPSLQLDQMAATALQIIPRDESSESPVSSVPKS